MSIIPAGITRTVATAALKTKKNSPHIFFGAGVAAVIGGTYLAPCNAQALGGRRRDQR